MAYHLARRGASVILVDRGGPACGVTGKSFAWINVSHGAPESCSRLRQGAIQEYHRLNQELNHALPLTWSGALTWDRDPAETQRFARERMARGYDVRLVDSDEIGRLEPALREVPRCAAFAANEGAVDPVAATRMIVAAAREAGAAIRLATGVVAVTSDDRRITGIRTGREEMPADVVVLAAGTAVAALAQPLGVMLPVRSCPAILLVFRTAQRLVNRVLSNPDVEVRQASDRVLLGVENYLGDSGENGPDAVARRALCEVRKTFADAAHVELSSVGVGHRPIPRDELPIVGFADDVDGLYLTVMHAGVTLAPVVARLAAAEILDGVTADLLGSCRVRRFLPS